MGHPGSVVTLRCFPGLVLGNPGKGPLGHIRVTTVGDEGGHAADGVGAPAMTGRHLKLGVRLHEGHRHRHLRAIGQDELAVAAELLDDREDVVPAAGIETGRVLPQLEEDLVHLERRQKRLDQDRGLDGAPEGCRAVPGSRRTRHSTAAPPDGSRAWAGRDTVRFRLRGPPCLRGTGTARSRRGMPTRPDHRPGDGARVDATPAGRTISRAVSSLSR